MASSKRIVLVTGGNGGLGLETVRALRNSPHEYDIIMGSRSLDKANESIKALENEPSIGGRTVIRPVQVDLDSDESIQSAFETVKAEYGKIDILVNNAGIQYEHLWWEGKISQRECWNRDWNTNTAGTHIMTDTFVPLLLQSKAPRILFVTSGLSTLQGTLRDAADVPPNRSPAAGWPKERRGTTPAYRSSKTGMNMMMREWARILKEDGVKVFCVSPGLLITNLANDPEFIRGIGGVPASVGAERMRSVIEGERDSDAGLIIFQDRIQPF
ncbi:MAG: hypothetical protein Q9159_004407 [Coniocarpon cinnabarinum]